MCDRCYKAGKVFTIERVRRLEHVFNQLIKNTPNTGKFKRQLYIDLAAAIRDKVKSIGKAEGL